MTADTDVRLVDLDVDSQEFVSVRNKIQLTLRCGVDKVQRVQNPYLYGKYEIRSNELPYKRRR